MDNNEKLELFTQFLNDHLKTDFKLFKTKGRFQDGGTTEFGYYHALIYGLGDFTIFKKVSDELENNYNGGESMDVLEGQSYILITMDEFDEDDIDQLDELELDQQDFIKISIKESLVDRYNNNYSDILIDEYYDEAPTLEGVRHDLGDESYYNYFH